MSETALKAVSLFGRKKPYHEVARRAFPVLVRQALASQTIEYGVLAKEIGVSNARNLNYPLGSVGRTMVELSERWSESIPPIQALVVNKADGLPGAGVGPFAPSASRFAAATQAERRLIVNGMLVEVFTYSNWGRVLTELGIGAWNVPHLPQPRRCEPLQKAERVRSIEP